MYCNCNDELHFKINWTTGIIQTIGIQDIQLIKLKANLSDTDLKYKLSQKIMF